MKGIFNGHISLVINAIYLPNNKIASCSSDKTVIFWDSENFQQETIFKSNEQPNSLLYLKQKNILFIGYRNSFVNGYTNIYDAFSPHKLISTIKDIHSWKIKELDDGNVAISQDQPPRIYIINSSNFHIMKQITDVHIIRNSGSLCVLNYKSFLYLWGGYFCQISNYGGNNYGIEYQTIESKKELSGDAGIVVIENGKYFITNTRNMSHSINIYECIY